MPDIENPSTFAEWYWKNSVDAAELRAEHIEGVLSPVSADILSGIPPDAPLPDYYSSLISGLTKPQDPGWDSVSVRFVSEIGSGLLNRVLGHEMKGFDYHMNSYLQNVLIDHNTANQLMLRRKITPELWLSRLNAAGYKETEANLMYETLKPYPDMSDIIRFARYAGEPTNPKAIAWDLYDISPSDWPIWEFLSRMKLNTEQVQQLFKRGILSTYETETELARIGWVDLDNHHVRSLAYSLPNAMLMVQGDLVQGRNRETILNDISKADIHPMYAETYLNAVLTKPASQDIIAYELRQDPSLSGLSDKLQRIGIHPDFIDVYKTLAYDIPPIADIITMAVREAFSPSIAARFGQYEDLPTEFIQWAEKKGLTREWAERYWAAHWGLPSPQQGFEMLHRGVIGFDDLNLLLRALDVMPFWRDKLTEIAYRPLTRVDVRRMYALGILDVNGVKRAYLDLGYNDKNAALMTDFTVEYTKGTPKKQSTASIISAYENHLIDESELRRLLSEAGIDSGDIQPVVNNAKQRRDWADKQDKINVISYQYKQGIIDINTARNELSALGLATDYIETLLPQWLAKSRAEKNALWTNAQTLGFFKTGMITEERARQELDNLGYDTEHIDIYIKSMQAQKA